MSDLPDGKTSQLQRIGRLTAEDLKASVRKPSLGAANATVQLVYANNNISDEQNPVGMATLLHQLAPGEAVRISYIRNSTLGIGIHRIYLQTLRRADDLGYRGVKEGAVRAPDVSSLIRAVEIACPGIRAIVASSPPSLHTDWRSLNLAPAGRLLDPEVLEMQDGDGSRSALKDMGAPTLRVAAQDRPVVRIAEALMALEALGQDYRLDLTVRVFQLGIQDKLLLSRTLRHLKPSYPEIMADPVGCLGPLGLARRLDTWTSWDCGWRLSCDLALPTDDIEAHEAIGCWLLGPLRTTLDLGGSASLDLATAWPASDAAPDFVPSGKDLERLGFAGTALLVPPPSQMSTGIKLGRSADGRLVTVPRPDLKRHMLIMGATGTGKSTLITSMIAQDIADGLPIILIDPHGDLFEDARRSFGKERGANVVVADMSEGAAPFGLDLLAGGDRDRAVHANYVANQLTTIFQRVLYRDVPEAFGPMFASYWRNALLLLMLSAPEGNPVEEGLSPTDGPNLADLDRVFCDKEFRNRLLSTCTEDHVCRFWREIAQKVEGEASLSNITPYITSKLSLLTGSPLLRPVLTDRKHVIDIPTILDSGTSILVNLAKGRTGETDAALIGALFTMQIFGSLLARCSRPRAHRLPLRIYCDEVQAYATDSLAQLLSEGRKAGAELTLATQDLTSFGGSQQRGNWAGTVLSNVGNLVTFRTGPADAALLSDWYRPDGIERADIMRMPDRVFAARTMENGVPQKARFGRTEAEVGSS